MSKQPTRVSFARQYAACLRFDPSEGLAKPIADYRPVLKAAADELGSKAVKSIRQIGWRLAYEAAK